MSYELIELGDTDLDGVSAGQSLSTGLFTINVNPLINVQTNAAVAAASGNAVALSLLGGASATTGGTSQALQNLRNLGLM
jgi:hypothetical protein